MIFFTFLFFYLFLIGSSKGLLSPGINLNEKISDMERNIKNAQSEYANKKQEYDNILKNFSDKKEVRN